MVKVQKLFIYYLLMSMYHPFVQFFNSAGQTEKENIEI